MSAFGIVDPMADWIDNVLNGGLRQKDRGTFMALFGRSPKEGGNDAICDDAPQEVKAYLEQNGPEALAEAFLKARDDYANWAKNAKEAARKRKDAKNKKRFDDDDVISNDMIEALDAANKEYNEAFAEVERYENGSPTIQTFSREQMKNLKKGDEIRFDHADADFDVIGYDAENDILTVHPSMGFEEEREKYRISPDGIERIYDDDELQTEYNTEGDTHDEPETENGTAETVAGNEESQTGGAEQPEAAEHKPADTAEAAEPEQVEKPDEAQVETAADAISANVGIPTEAIKDGLQDRLDGKEKIEPDVLSLVDKSLPKGDPVREALEAKAESEGDNNLSLESVSPEQLKKEEKRNRERAEIERLLAKPIKGGGVEENQSLFDLGGIEGEDLFNRVQTMAVNAMSGNPSPEVRDAAAEAQNAVEEVRQHEATASELEDFLSEMEGDLSGGDGAIIEAAIDDAIESEDEASEQSTARAEKGLKELSRLHAESFKTAEKTAKGETAAKVENILTDLAKTVFPKDAKSDRIGEEAESVAESVAAYAKEKGVDHELDAPVRDVIDDIKKDEDKLEGLMSEFQQTMNAAGTDFHEEDARHVAGALGRLAADIANKFNLLRSMDRVEKKRIDDEVKLKQMVAELQGDSQPEAEETQTEETSKEKKPKGSTREQIADIYADWVEEDVPEWVNNLSDDEAKEYVGLLEDAREHGGDEDSKSLDNLEKFEKSHKNAKPKKKEETAKAETAKAAPKAEAPKAKQEESKASAEEMRKAAVQAARRLGVEAYKPDDVLEKMLETAKAHISDPRQAQRAKDIETILADRKAKGKREVSQAEINASRAERKFKNRTSDTEMLPSESFKNIKRDYSEGTGNQLNDDWEPSKSEINAEDSMPEKSTESHKELVARLVVEALEEG